MNYLKLAGAVGLVALAFGAGALFNGYRWETRYQALQLDHADASLQTASNAISQIHGFGIAMNSALNRFTKQQEETNKDAQDLQTLLLDVRGTVSGLRGDFSKLPGRINTATRATLAEYADTCTAVFERVAEAGGRMAEGGARIAGEAEKHSANERLMIESWPKAQK